jgi:ABC-type sugar transport system ATPase subunit
MVSVNLVELSKHFKGVVAVDNLNLKIRDGEFVALLGPSGCGKTTTLLMIAGIYRPTRGYIYFDDMLMNDIPPKDRNVGMVFQSYALYPHMTVYDNIAFPLKLKKRPKDEIRKKIVEVTKMLGIHELLDRKPSQLSGGQQQRVALARALVKEPNIFLMDEPLSNLDAKLRIQMRAELKRMQKDLGITTIYVTHDQVEAMTMADRIAVMNLGRLQQYGPPDELYNKPKNLFVAGFIGSIPMNFIEGYLRRRDGEIILEGPDYMFKIPREYIEIIKEYNIDEEVILGVRPEDIILLKGEYTGLVYVVEPLGRDKIIHIDIGDAIIRALAPGDINIKEGKKINFEFNEDRIHLFNRKSGDAII